MTNLRLTNSAKQADMITHNETFHADEVFATVILSKTFDDMILCRTSSVPDDLPEYIIVYDIGCGKYSQVDECRKNGVPYSTCGLIWRDFGRKMLENFEHVLYDEHLFGVKPELIEAVWSIIDVELIQGIDAIDNGTMPQTDYPAQSMSVSTFISNFNPPEYALPSEVNAEFIKAVEFATLIFDRVLENTILKAKRWYDIVKAGIAASYGHFMVLNQYVPWQYFIFSSDNPKAADIQFVVFPSELGDYYNCQCVPDAFGSFDQRKPLPESWGGLRDKALQDVSGVENAIFCDVERFICAAKNYKGAFRLAKLAVEA